MVVARQHATFEEFLRLPEEEPALEFEDGVITQKGSPQGKHSALQLGLGKLIDTAGMPGRVARAFTELRCTFAGRSYVPDVSVFLWERIPVDSNGEIANEVVVPPDIAIEIISPGQSATALARRAEWYVANGVRAALAVNDRARTVGLHRPGLEARTLRGAERVDLDDLLPGFELTPDALFATLRVR